MNTRLLSTLKHIPLETWMWSSGLLYLGALQPTRLMGSICPVHLAGFDWCPGCGIGRSISYLMHGELGLSLETHPLGIIVFIVVLHRIVTLTYKSTRSYDTSN